VEAKRLQGVKLGLEMTDGGGSFVNHPGERWTGIGVDGTKAKLSAGRYGQAPQPLTGCAEGAELDVVHPTENASSSHPAPLRRTRPVRSNASFAIFLFDRRRLNCDQ